MKLLDRYILRELFLYFIGVLLVLAVVFVIQRLIFLTEWSMNRGVGMGGILKLLFCLFPGLFLTAIPLVSLMVMIVVFSRLCEENELVVIFSSGRGIFSLLGLGALFSLFSALLCAYLSFLLVPRSLIKFRLLRFELVQAKSEQALPTQRFIQFGEESWIYVQSKDEAGLGNLILFQRSSQELMGLEGETLVFAQKGRIRNIKERAESWLSLKNGVVLARDKNNRSEIFFQFEKARLKLSLESEEVIRSVRRALETKTLPELFKTWKKRFSGKKPHLSKKAREYKKQLLVEIHQRLAQVASCVLLFLWGVGLGIKPPRSSRTVSYLLGIVGGFSYYYLNVIFKALALKGSLGPAFSLWLVVLVIFFTGGGLVWARTKGKEPLEFIYQFDLYFKEWLSRRKNENLG